jgi:hypothetical protein
MPRAMPSFMMTLSLRPKHLAHLLIVLLVQLIGGAPCWEHCNLLTMPEHPLQPLNQPQVMVPVYRIRNMTHRCSPLPFVIVCTAKLPAR